MSKQDWTVIAGDLAEFVRQDEILKKENKIIEKHISSQLVQVPNPSFIKSFSPQGTPELATTVIISGVYLVEKLPESKKK